MDHFDALPEDGVVSARSQTSGRGRFGRKWISPDEGNLYLSVVLKNDLPHGEWSALTPVAATALARAVERHGLSPRIRWPNDLFLSGKKTAGILCETAWRGGRVRGAVVGIGLNVNASDTTLASVGRPATSMRAERGHPLDVDAVLESVLRALFDHCRVFRAKGFAPLFEEWNARLDCLGKSVAIGRPGSALRGIVEAVNPDASLTVRVGDTRRTVCCGEILD
jgi:BirA family biotin operon repressor/biotin-[acetyl-CoA-carboxylase] ligase